MIVYDVWAEWCPPCKKFGPIFEKVSKNYPDIAFQKVDADLNNEFLQRYSIFSIPTILLTDDSGEVIFQHAGILTEANFDMLVATHYLAVHK